MTSSDGSDWSFDTAREPALFGLAVDEATPEKQHAYRGDGTLCGLPDHRVVAYRTLFHPENAKACPACRQQCEAAPTLPSVQERLHDQVLEAEEGPLHEELLAALLVGADVRLWISGPAAQMAKFYARLDQIVDGRAAVAAALDTGGIAGLARVQYGSWEYIVALPHGGRATIGRATPDHQSDARVVPVGDVPAELRKRH
ncbi:DUF5364 domain-containing protein [Actinoplanes sp. L3-i22]|uniref:DUF5364 domain-containing protein n=1 Tax=Actinoplanes sp. L3-i22 TaxID=2836373 RepID=UPI001C762696|nr:DUF5364 domain-containing protein [Actinoplanes sp. L3-i22]BCY05400.1 hypothetical protein L3i22_004880 [Actinoplanes sp. L3-i22]